MNTALSYPQTSMAVLPASLGARYGTRPAVIDGDRVLTFADIAAKFGCCCGTA